MQFLQVLISGVSQGCIYGLIALGFVLIYKATEAVSFRALNQLNLKTSRAWCIKENFSQFWSYSYKGAAKRYTSQHNM